ncbi:MAG: N5-glutamine methyltransferase family protein [Verrucomicrobiales bacterium]
MKTILEVLTAGASFLERKGVESPRLNMEHLLAHALGMRRMDLYRQFDRPVSESELAPLREWTTRRASGEPLQHLLGTVEFHRFSFRSDGRALIPRPETEELVEKIIARRRKNPPHWILDMGCGSGVIGLSLAAMFSDAHVILADASPTALELARQNATLVAEQIKAQPYEAGNSAMNTQAGAMRNPRVAESSGPSSSDSTLTPDTKPLQAPPSAAAAPDHADLGASFLARLTFVATDLFSVFESALEKTAFDVLAANLPYIPSGEIAGLSREVRCDPMEALDGGDSGLELIERFIVSARHHCAPGALVALEHGPEQGEGIARLLRTSGFEQICVEPDLTGRPRFTFATAP